MLIWVRRERAADSMSEKRPLARQVCARHTTLAGPSSKIVVVCDGSANLCGGSAGIRRASVTRAEGGEPRSRSGPTRFARSPQPFFWVVGEAGKQFFYSEKKGDVRAERA
jgi:hypothetical protein